MFRKLCGRTALKSVVLVTIIRDDVPHDIGEAHEEELFSKKFRLALDGGAQMVRHHNTVQSTHDIIRRIVENYPVVLRIQRELAEEQRNLVDTSAGETLVRELNEQIRQDRDELEEVQVEMKRASRKKDEETMWRLEEERRKLWKQMEEAALGLKAMDSDHAAGKERTELTRAEEKERKAKEERAEADRRRQPAGHTHGHQDETDDDDDPIYG